MIKKDGLNFLHLYFLNYTWYVNDLHNIWKRWSYSQVPLLERSRIAVHQRQLRAKWLLCSTRFFCVREFIKTESATAVQRTFRLRFNIQPPTRKNICRWNYQFEQIGCLCKGKSSGRPRVSEENVRWTKESFERSPHKSTRRASRELGIPQSTVWRVLRRRLLFNWVQHFESLCIFLTILVYSLSIVKKLKIKWCGLMTPRALKNTALSFSGKRRHTNCESEIIWMDPIFFLICVPLMGFI